MVHLCRMNENMWNKITNEKGMIELNRKENVTTSGNKATTESNDVASVNKHAIKIVVYNIIKRHINKFVGLISWSTVEACVRAGGQPSVNA